jgi:hypothetical protein
MVDTVILLLNAGKPVVAFSDVMAMRAWLRARGSLTSRLYTRKEVLLDPDPDSPLSQ